MVCMPPVKPHSGEVSVSASEKAPIPGCFPGLREGFGTLLLSQHQICLHLDLGLPASRTTGKPFPVARATPWRSCVTAAVEI